MKKVWSIRKNEDAVSPVIATILMVAITVVLAAVLYVMVMGMSGSDTDTAPATSWEIEDADATGDVIQIKLISSGADLDLTQYKITIEQTGVTTTIDPLAVSGVGVADAMSAGDVLTIDMGAVPTVEVGTTGTGATGATLDIVADQIVTINIYFNPSGQQIMSQKAKAEA